MKLILDYDISDFEDIDVLCECNVNEEAQKVVELILAEHNMEYDCNVSLSFVSEQVIQELNKENRDIDKVTDVLSFPNVTFDEPGNYDILEDESCYFDFFDPEEDTLILGDIVICFEKAKSQAKEYGHSLKREVLFLVAHSTLHLLGYDHMTEEERSVMEEKQKYFLDKLGIYR